jgi:general secretion pathway protein E
MVTALLAPQDYTVSRLADVLVSGGFLNDEERSKLEEMASASEQRLIKAKASSMYATPGNASVTPPEVVASMHLTTQDGRSLDEDLLMQSVALLSAMPYKKIDPLKLNHGLITNTMTRPFARRHVCLPLSKSANGTVTFAIDNPFDQDLLHQLSQLVGGKVKFVVSAKSDILRIITEIYGFKRSVEAAERDISAGIDLGNLEQLVRLKKVDELEADDQHIVNAVEYLLHYAYDQRASDIHIEPGREEARVRMRIDGVLHELFRVPLIVHKAMVSRLKTLARMDIAERRKAQDGRIKTAVGHGETELRVSTLPVAFGEKMVLRIFDPGRMFSALDELGFDRKQHEQYIDFLSQRTGLILVTGPTGSGKTTTLYSTLHHLSSPDINIVSIEDPIEMVSESFNQVAVHKRIGLDFAQGLRSILRQDPDIIMVGEIRDTETAQMAVQAALTGHLVLSTVHTNNAAGAVTRLRDLDVPEYLISSTLIGIVAQRLLRKVCDHCSTEANLTAAQASALAIDIPPGTEPELPVRYGSGCPHCRETGLYGRVGIFETLEVNHSIRELIRNNADTKTLYRAAQSDGMITLREAAIALLAAGKTSFNEVVRVLGDG